MTRKFDEEINETIWHYLDETCEEQIFQWEQTGTFPYRLTARREGKLIYADALEQEMDCDEALDCLDHFRAQLDIEFQVRPNKTIWENLIEYAQYVYADAHVHALQQIVIDLEAVIENCVSKEQAECFLRCAILLNRAAIGLQKYTPEWVLVYDALEASENFDWIKVENLCLYWENEAHDNKEDPKFQDAEDLRQWIFATKN